MLDVASLADALAGIIAFSALTKTELQSLERAAQPRKAPRGATLFREGDEGEGLFIVRTGEIKVTKAATDGREQIFYLARPGRALVEGVRFDGGTLSATAVALRPSTAALITNAKLAELGERAPSILKALVDLRARRADRNLALIADLSLRTVPARLASFICKLMAVREARGENPISFVRELTTETVAGRLGTVREEVSRGLAFLEREGALRVTPHMIEVLDVERLEAIAYGKRDGA
jgi:CRP/FNR family transcriptional regulator, dissimilatory nitrate respiration regulator